MRIRAQFSFAVTQAVLIIDPAHVFEPIDEEPFYAIEPGVPCFGESINVGRHRVYRCGDCLVVDTAPRQFRPGKRLEFDLIGEVLVDSGMVVVLDTARVPDLDPFADFAVTCDLPAGRYVAWCEENENSVSQQRAILGIGSKPQLFLAGVDATSIHELETELAAVLRIKGPARQARVQELRDKIMELHLSGSKDRRLEMLASAVKLDLPARRGKKFKRP